MTDWSQILSLFPLQPQMQQTVQSANLHESSCTVNYVPLGVELIRKGLKLILIVIWDYIKRGPFSHIY